MNWSIKGKLGYASFTFVNTQFDGPTSKTDVKYIIDNTALTNTVLMTFSGGNNGGGGGNNGGRWQQRRWRWQQQSAVATTGSNQRCWDTRW